MENRAPLLPSPQLLSSPMLPTSKFDYFHHSQEEPEKRGHLLVNERKRQWPFSSDDTCDHARDAYLTPDPSSQLGFSSPPRRLRKKPLTAIRVLRPKVSGEPLTIGRSSVQCTHPIPQQWLNLRISRVHVVISYLQVSREIRVQCRGINSVSVSTSAETHKLEKGDEMKLREGEDFRVNIGGYDVIVESPELETEEFAQVSVPMLSPPIKRITYSEPEKTSQSSPTEARFDVPSPSPLPEVLPHQITEATQSPEIQIYHDSSESASQSSLSPPPENLSPPEPISPVNEPSENQLPRPTDLALIDALLTTLIFAEVKPTPLPRLVADLVHRMPNVQQDRIKAVLEATPCVGIVHRSGKDAAGKPLNDEYHYIAESNHLHPFLKLTLDDEDEARRNRYYQFARPTRSCRLKHSQYHWRPVKLHSHKSRSVTSSPGKENALAGGKRKKVEMGHNPEVAAEQGKDENVEVSEEVVV